MVTTMRTNDAVMRAVEQIAQAQKEIDALVPTFAELDEQLVTIDSLLAGRSDDHGHS
ncbi:hypothetical protein [Nitratireductor soli]|uniref:hypothetical protein n=1 Tax=Nitratireductor soli TaxID=1670619 RepID=UPI00138F8A16|nr:hypothetical protein [Nitratireductor soli]